MRLGVLSMSWTRGDPIPITQRILCTNRPPGPYLVYLPTTTYVCTPYPYSVAQHTGNPATADVFLRLSLGADESVPLG